MSIYKPEGLHKTPRKVRSTSKGRTPAQHGASAKNWEQARILATVGHLNQLQSTLLGTSQDVKNTIMRLEELSKDLATMDSTEAYYRLVLRREPPATYKQPTTDRQGSLL